ncbi:MAG: hypothetical protein ABI353_03600 [Isosphaeraceae bacterium]
MAARKSNKARRKKNQAPKRLFKQELSTPVPLFRPELNALIPPGDIGIYEPDGVEKMSKVLQVFMEPYWGLAESEDAARSLLALAAAAWNATLLPEDQRNAMLDEILRTGFARSSAKDRVAAREFIETMIRRKEELFASNRRMIASFKLTNLGDQYHLSVASSF